MKQSTEDLILDYKESLYGLKEPVVLYAYDAYLQAFEDLGLITVNERRIEIGLLVEEQSYDIDVKMTAKDRRGIERFVNYHKGLDLECFMDQVHGYVWALYNSGIVNYEGQDDLKKYMLERFKEINDKR